MKKITLLCLLLAINVCFAQENLTYQKPSQEILELADAPTAPLVWVINKGEYLVFRYRDYYKSINELSEPELRLAGLRINPKTNIGSRTNYYNNLKVRKRNSQDMLEIKGMPENARLANFSISPNETKIAMTNTTGQGVEVWILDILKAEISKITEANVNGLSSN